jgi:hypothetical protein
LSKAKNLDTSNITVLARSGAVKHQFRGPKRQPEDAEHNKKHEDAIECRALLHRCKFVVGEGGCSPVRWMCTPYLASKFSEVPVLRINSVALPPALSDA